ncbi:MAG TPA: DUF421 domain-containing protein, partial [Virgibacillus sp.]
RGGSSHARGKRPPAVKGNGVTLKVLLGRLKIINKKIFKTKHIIRGGILVDLSFIWKAVLIVVAGTFFLRVAGRKSVSQLTIAQTVLIIAIGTLLIQPVVSKNIWTTFAVAGVLVLTILIMDYVQIKKDSTENLITGKSKVLIENGVINEENLKKVKLTVDQLEMNLRQKNIKKISDVKWATLEMNGQMGYMLKEEAQPVTKAEFQQLMSNVQQILNELQTNSIPYGQNQQTNSIRNQMQTNNQDDLFSEVKQQGHKNTPPEHLQ